MQDSGERREAGTQIKLNQNDDFTLFNRQMQSCKALHFSFHQLFDRVFIPNYLECCNISLSLHLSMSD